MTTVSVILENTEGENQDKSNQGSSGKIWHKATDEYL